MKQIATIAVFVIGMLLAPFNTHEQEALNHMKVGERTWISRPSGDGCNSTAWEVEKVSDTEVRPIKADLTTLLACPSQFPAEKFK